LFFVVVVGFLFHYYLVLLGCFLQGTSTQATAPEKSTPVEQDNNKTPNENSQNEPLSEQDNNETPDQQQEDNAVTEQTNTPEESTPVTQDNNWAFYCCLAQLGCSFQVQWLVCWVVFLYGSDQQFYFLKIVHPLLSVA
jgi:hypothetical protein